MIYLHDVFLIWIRSEQCKIKCAILSCEPNNQLNIVVCTISVTEGEVAGLKLVKAPSPSNSLLTVPRRWL